MTTCAPKSVLDYIFCPQLGGIQDAKITFLKWQISLCVDEYTLKNLPMTHRL